MSLTIIRTMASRFLEELIQMKPLLPTYFHLIASAIFPIYIAAHASLRRPSSAAPAKKLKSSNQALSSDEDENQDSSTPIEALTTSDAILFPVLAGATLTGLYVVIKWLEDPAILNKILGYYFSWVGTFFTFKFLKDSLYIIRSFIFPLQLTYNGRLHKIDLDENAFVIDQSMQSSASNSLITSLKTRFVLLTAKSKLYWMTRQRIFAKLNCSLSTRRPLSNSVTKFAIDTLDILAGLSSVILAALPSTLSKTPWYLTNLSGFSFCYGSLQFITPGTSATGSLLLSLLFFYDIYMVFYTPMMVTVATKLDVPIKLLIPRPADPNACPVPFVGLSESETAKEIQKCLAKQRTMAMLGLGDIVIPGIMIAFALRFDLYNHYRKMSKLDVKKDEKRPTYIPARGMWAERWYSTRAHWSSTLLAKAFPKPYFKATMVGYIAGMVATVVVMQVFKHAQPALLYLVPGVLSTFWGMALLKGEVKTLWAYDEAIEEKESEKKIKEKEEGKKSKTGGEKKDEDGNENSKTKDQKKEDVDPCKPIVSFHVYLGALGTMTKSTTVHSGKPSSDRPENGQGS